MTSVNTAQLEKALSLRSVSAAQAMGAYLLGRIYLREEAWNPESFRAQSYLVHELVHHIQLVSHRSYPCHAVKEREAYMLQNEWLQEHGQAPIVSQSWIDRISSCQGSDLGAHESL